MIFSMVPIHLQGGTLMSTEPNERTPYFNEIAERLWSNRATVMVGAGFSKNADNSFPNWNDLGDIFYEKAYGTKPTQEQKSYLNVLHLAEEVQASFGRSVLNQLLKTHIPDDKANPSELHKNLLELPWNDVFTTNYDTLLEKSSNEIPLRRYEVVLNEKHIPYANKPRIIKLHGSFPSESPFIITEEDYRRYPYDYAPFVNTVQQSLLENTFCLIGFSGDDPNFLHWIGWLRDNLKNDTMQKIYLIGVFNLSASRKKLLEQRGITVIDYAYGDNSIQDHGKALKDFCKCMNLRNPNKLTWPKALKEKDIKEKDIFELPDVFTWPDDMIHPNDKHPQNITLAINVWKYYRSIYPGWLVLPYSNRTTLFLWTKNWINKLPDIEKENPGDDILYTYELIWRLDRCLIPINDSIEKYCSTLLKRYWPFKEKSSYHRIRLDAKEYSDLPWNDIRHAWLHIILSLLRVYREKGEITKWTKTKTKIDGIKNYLSSEQEDFLYYEIVLFSLFTLKPHEAIQKLYNWKPTGTNPYWKTKRATALAELGILDNSIKDIQLSLVESRKDVNNNSYVSFSNEAFQIMLLDYIEDAEKTPATAEEEKLMEERFLDEFQQKKSEATENDRIKQQINFKTQKEDWDDLCKNKKGTRRQEWDKLLNDVRNEGLEKKRLYREYRRDELKAFRCDPLNELKIFELQLASPMMQNPPKEETSLLFDIGETRRTLRFIHQDFQGLQDFRGFSFLRFCEEIGLPYQVGLYTMAPKSISKSLQEVSQYSLFWSVASLLRLGYLKNVEHIFNRKFVDSITQNQATQLISTYLNILTQHLDSNDNKPDNSLDNHLLKLLPEIISRLCCKCSYDVKKNIIEFIIKVYKSTRNLDYDNINNLVNRLIKSLSHKEKYELIPELLKIRAPEYINVRISQSFPNPFLQFRIQQNFHTRNPITVNEKEIDHLLEQAKKQDSPDHRMWAITSLSSLYDVNLLNKQQVEIFAKNVWDKTDENKLPDDTNFYKFAWLTLPHPKTINPTQLFKKYINSQISNNNSSNDSTIIHEILAAYDNDKTIWTDEELFKIVHWIRDEYKNFALKVKSLYFHKMKAAEKKNIYQRITESLMFDKEEQVREDGLVAISNILLHNDTSQTIFKKYSSLLNQYVTWAPTESLHVTFLTVIRILRQNEEKLSPDLKELIIQKLQQLLNDTSYDNDTGTLNFEENLRVRKTSTILASILYKHYKSADTEMPNILTEWKKEIEKNDEFAEIRNAWRNEQ